jgi:pentatricopeptide repeat protein
MNNTVEVAAPEVDTASTEHQVREILELAQNLQLYGSYPELRAHARTGRWEDALQLVRRLRLEDNKPLQKNAKLDGYLRFNEHMLLELELKIVELLSGGRS